MEKNEQLQNEQKLAQKQTTIEILETRQEERQKMYYSNPFFSEKAFSSEEVKEDKQKYQEQMNKKKEEENQIIKEIQDATNFFMDEVQDALRGSMKEKKRVKREIEDSLNTVEKNLMFNNSQYSKEVQEEIFKFQTILVDSLNEVRDAIHQAIIERENIFSPFGIYSAKKIDTLYKKAMDDSSSIVEKEKIADELFKQLNKVSELVQEGKIPEDIGNSRIMFLDSKVKEINRLIPTLPEFQEQININPKQSVIENGIPFTDIKEFFANKKWFQKKAKKEKGLVVERKKNKLVKKAIGIGTVAVTGVLALSGISVMAYSNYKLRKENESLKIEAQKDLEKKLENVKNVTLQSTKEAFGKKEETTTEEKVVANYFKEEQIMELVEELKEQLNSHDGMNVTTEQALALFIHVNAANSYANGNTLALDKITRENLIKKYYVGLTEGTEEFDSYIITDADLSRLSAGVQEVSNAAVNRVAVLNDKGNYEESKEIIGIFKGFITDESLKDEASVLTISIQNMQTSNAHIKKRELYRYYNYIFAGPKSDVRNFDDYGHYVDGDNKEMTFENQGTTIRFYTWFIDPFAGLHVKGIIPQDIINSKNVKLMDQANLLRILGFNNCNTSVLNANYALYFDQSIENGKKSSTGKSSSSSSSKSSTIAHAFENQQSNVEMDAQLKQNTNMGDTFDLRDGSTVIIVDTGDTSKTVVVIPDPSSEEIKDTTPSGDDKRETTEGGGNEKEEDIKFKEDEPEKIIDEGGSIIYDDSTDDSYFEEEITFEEEETEIVIEVIDEIEQPQTIEQEENIDVSYAITNEINTLSYLRDILTSEDTLTLNNDENNFEYVKTFRI